MILGFLAMASALALPDAGMPEVRRLLNDVPAGLKRDGKWTVADVVVFVDPKGRVKECTIIQYAGEQQLAELLCVLLKRNRIRPASDFEGQPAYGVTPLRVSIHDSPKPPVDFDKPDREELVLSLATLPVTSDGIPIESVSLMLEIGPDAVVRHCESRDEQREDIVAVACQNVNSFPFEVRTDDLGEGVTYVRGFDIIFELADE